MVSHHEDGSFCNGRVDIARGWLARLVFIDGGVRIKSCWMFAVKDGNDAIFYGNSLASKGDNSLDDIFIFAEGRVVIRVFEDNNLSTLGGVLFIL